MDIVGRVKDLLRPEPEEPTLALVLGGGGARAAYQVGALQFIIEQFPEINFRILTGVSAGAINVAHLANHAGSLREAVPPLLEAWRGLTPEQVYSYEESSKLSLLWSFFRRSALLGEESSEENLLNGKHAMVDTEPLRTFLENRLQAKEGQLTGIASNLRAGRLAAVALITTNYATGQTVTWVEGRNIELWERPNRVSVNTTLTIDHVMASTALPFLFPAIRIGDAWYGDGGIRLAAPLSPAIHLGADRLLVISTRYNRSRVEADEPSVTGYPPTAQLMGILMSAIFLDALEDDALIMDRLNKLLEELPRRKRFGLRPIKQLTLRPSLDLGKLSGAYEMGLPPPLQMLTRSLGTDETKSPDWLSMLLFQEDYISRLTEIGYNDARSHFDQIASFLNGG